MSAETTMVMLLSLPIIFGGFFATMHLDNDKRSKAVILIPFALSIFISMILMALGVYWSGIESEQTKQAFLTEFEELDCKEMADSILQNYLVGNNTLSSIGIPIFKEHGCQFDISTQIILEGN